MKSPKALARDSGLLSIESYSLVSENREDYLRLDLNENLAGCSPKVIAAIRNASVQDVSTYPSYSLVSKLIAEVEGIDQCQILITAGIDDGIRLVFEAFLGLGDKLLLVVPTFSMYRVYAEIRGVEVVSVPFSSDFSYPFENVLETVSKEKPKILVVVNPNNPTGTFLSKTELEALVQQVRILSPRTLIVVDEAYREFAQIDLSFLARDYENVLLMRTFSKSYGLAGLRIGYIMGNATIVDFLRKLSPPFPVSKLACVAVQAAIIDEEFLRTYVEQVSQARELVKQALVSRGFKVQDSKANFLLAEFGLINDWLNEKLRTRKILIRNRTDDTLLQGYSRITIGDQESMTVFLQAIDDILSEPVLLFDMDGVLVDVSQSYDKAIIRCVEHFTKEQVDREAIFAVRQKYGLNNDWLIAQRLVRERGKHITLAAIRNVFQEAYKETKANEKWILNTSLLSKLSSQYRLGIVTGRPRDEALYTLEKFGVLKYFLSVITLDDVPNDKPDPYGIRLCLQNLSGKNGFFFGDTVNDVLAARAAEITSVGVINTSGLTFSETQEILKQFRLGKRVERPDIEPRVLLALKYFADYGTDYVLPTINDLEEILA